MEARRGLLMGIGMPTMSVAIAMFWLFIGIVSVLNWRTTNVTFQSPVTLPNELGWLVLAVPMGATMLLLWLMRWARLDAMGMIPHAEHFSRAVRALGRGPRIADYRQAPKLRLPGDVDESELPDEPKPEPRRQEQSS